MLNEKEPELASVTETIDVKKDTGVASDSSSGSSSSSSSTTSSSQSEESEDDSGQESLTAHKKKKRYTKRFIIKFFCNYDVLSFLLPLFFTIYFVFLIVNVRYNTVLNFFRRKLTNSQP